MKKVLITGKGSYIGNCVEAWLGRYAEKYLVDVVDMQDSQWKNKEFSEYDSVFHTHQKLKDLQF